MELEAFWQWEPSCLHGRCCNEAIMFFCMISKQGIGLQLLEANGVNIFTEASQVLEHHHTRPHTLAQPRNKIFQRLMYRFYLCACEWKPGEIAFRAHFCNQQREELSLSRIHHFRRSSSTRRTTRARCRTSSADRSTQPSCSARGLSQGTPTR